MRVPERKRNGSLGFNMTPMIDVVFLLIIFFLVSSHLAKSEAQLQLPLPEAASGNEVDEERVRVVINVDPTGQIFVSGRALEPTDLQGTMQSVLHEKGEDVQLSIRSASQVPYGQIVPIIRAAAGAGIWDVHFAVIPTE